MLLWLAVMLVNFYVLPLLMNSTGAVILLMLVVIPAVCLVASVWYGRCCGFEIWLPLLTAMLWLPTLWLYYNVTAWVYAPGYALPALLGCWLGGRSRLQRII